MKAAFFDIKVEYCFAGMYFVSNVIVGSDKSPKGYNGKK